MCLVPWALIQAWPAQSPWISEQLSYSEPPGVSTGSGGRRGRGGRLPSQDHSLCGSAGHRTPLCLGHPLNRKGVIWESRRKASTLVLQTPRGGTLDPARTQLPWDQVGVERCSHHPPPPTSSCSVSGAQRVGPAGSAGTCACCWAQSSWAQQEPSSFQAGSPGEACSSCPRRRSVSPPPLGPGQQRPASRHQTHAPLLTLAGSVLTSLPLLLGGELWAPDPPAQPPSLALTLRSGYPEADQPLTQSFTLGAHKMGCP